MTGAGDHRKQSSRDVGEVHPVTGLPLLADSHETCRSCAHAVREQVDDLASPVRCKSHRNELLVRVAARRDGWEAAAASLVDQADTLWGYASESADYPACVTWASREADEVLMALGQQPPARHGSAGQLKLF